MMIVAGVLFGVTIAGSLGPWIQGPMWPTMLSTAGGFGLLGLVFITRIQGNAVDAIRHEVRVFSADTKVLAAVRELEDHRENLNAATAGQPRGVRTECLHAFHVLVWWAADQPPDRMPGVLDAADALCCTARSGASSRDRATLADAISHINQMAYLSNHTPHLANQGPSAVEVVDGAQR